MLKDILITFPQPIIPSNLSHFLIPPGQAVFLGFVRGNAGAQEKPVQSHPFPHRKYFSMWEGHRLQKGERPSRSEVRVGHLNMSGSWWLVGLKRYSKCSLSLGSLTNSGLCWTTAPSAGLGAFKCSAHLPCVGYVLRMQTAPRQCLDNCISLLRNLPYLQSLPLKPLSSSSRDIK